MSRETDLTIVVRLACLTEDRSDAEQRALLRIADAIDHEHNKRTVDKVKEQDAPGWRPSFLYDEVQSTRVLADKQKPVELANRTGIWPRKG